MNPTPLATRLGYLPAVLLVLSALALSLALVRPAGANPAPGTAIIERQVLFDDELGEPGVDDGWTRDRAHPDGWTASDDGASVTVRIDGTTVAGSVHSRTEGAKLLLEGTNATRAEIDLYLDPAWGNTPVRAGLWLQGAPGASPYAIIEFVSGSGIGPESNRATESQIRTWRTNTGTWVNTNYPFEFGETVRLAAELNEQSNQYDYYVNGEYVGSAENEATETHFSTVFVNHYDYKNETRETLTTGYEVVDYEVKWSNLVVTHTFDSIQAAVDAAEGGETIEVGPGEFNEAVSIYTSGITLEGSGSALSTIAPTSGAAVSIAGDTHPILTDITVRGFTLAPAGAGMGLIALSGTLSVDYDTSGLVLDDLVVDGTTNGIGLMDAEDVSMSNIVLRNITPPGSNGALELTGVSNVTITDSIFTGNTTAIRLQETEHLSAISYGTNGAVSVTDSIFVGNGVAIRNGEDHVTIDASDNWWGSNSGPGATAVEGNVDTDPYLTPEISSITVTPPSPVSSATTSVAVLVGFVNSTGVTHTVSSNASNLVDGVNVITVTSTLTVAGQTYTDTETVQVTRLAASTPTPTPSPSPTTPPVTVQEPGGVSVDLENEETAPVSQTSSTTVSTTSEDGAGLTVTVPAGALPAGVPAGSQLLVAAVSNPDEVSASAPPPTGADVVAHFLVDVVDPQGRALNGEFNQPVTLTFSLPAGSVAPGASGDAVVLAYWNGSEWVEVEATVTVHPNGSVTLSAQVTHFTLFSAFEAPASWGTFKPMAVQRGLTITTWMGGSFSRLVEHLQTGNSLWTSKGGKLIGYIHGAPDWVNKTFFDTYPEGLPLETPVIIAKR